MVSSSFYPITILHRVITTIGGIILKITVEVKEKDLKRLKELEEVTGYDASFLMSELIREAHRSYNSVG